MNYSNKFVAISGCETGFIADKLAQELAKAGAIVTVVTGDIRQASTFDSLNFKHDYYFHFAAPSSQILFKRKPRYCVEVTLKGFINAAEACENNGIKMIYPSTGLLSSGETNEYARCKKICEDIAPGDALGLRIFATYGPGEGHKRDYASVPYLFAKDMVKGKRPVVFGDGTQTRDLIYIDDVVNAIMVLAEEANEPIIDIGSGEGTSFNRIIKQLKALVGRIEPRYIDVPNNYVKQTLADTALLRKYYKPQVTFTEGIAKLVESLK